MVEMQLISVNPVRLVEQLSRKSSEREAYISFLDVQAIAHACPEWVQAIIWTGYYTGMRRGRILSLKRYKVDLSRRFITLSPDETKEDTGRVCPSI